jgi:HEAT repeat protein
MRQQGEAVKDAVVVNVEHQLAHFVRTADGANWWRRVEVATGLGTLWPRCASRPELARRWADPVRRILITAARDEHRLVRWAAVRGLERVGGELVREALTGALADADQHVRFRACLAAGRVGADSYLAPLVTALDDRWTRTVAAEALGRLRQPTREAIAVLDARVAGADQYLSREIARSMARLAVREPALGTVVASRLRGLLSSPEAVLREAGVLGLAILRPEAWLDKVAQALADPEPSVRVRAVEELTRHGGQPGIELVQRCVDDPTPVVCQRLADALAKVPATAPTLAILDRLVDDKRPEVARSAVRATGSAGPVALPRLRRMLSHHSPAVRDTAASTLPPLGDRDDVALLRALFTDPHARVSAIRGAAALDRRLRGTPRRLRSPLLEPIAAVLHDPDHRPRYHAAWALGLLGDRRAIPLLRAAVAEGRLHEWEVSEPLRRLSATLRSTHP